MVETHIAHEPFELLNLSHDPVRGDLRFLTGGASKKPAVIVCHSFMAFKDWGFFPRVGEQLAALGFASITFNFSHDGVTGDGTRITDLERFASNTFSREIDDLGVVVDAVAAAQLGSHVVENRTIVLLGHSRGGGIAILRAAIDRRIAALVTWSSVSSLDRWTEHQKKRWRSDGYLPLARDTAASPLRLGVGLLEDLERNAERLNIEGAARHIDIPWLILHGKADVTVPPREAERLFACAPPATTKLLLLDGIGHLYNAASRSEDSYAALDSILKITADWLHHNLP